MSGDGPGSRDAGPDRPPARARDPEGRRAAIVAAAAQVVAEVGAGRATHRSIAERAGVPLGATTYYFPTLRDLVAAALDSVTEANRALLARWAVRLDESSGPGHLPRDLAALAGEYAADRGRALLEYELYLAAAREPGLRASAQAWVDGLTELLAPRTGPAGAQAAAAFLDGVVVQCLATGAPVDTEALEAALSRLLA